MNLVADTHPVLHKHAIPVIRFDSELREFVDELSVFMYQCDGIGIAAPQVGDPRSIAIVDHTLGEDPNALLVLINPEIAYVDPTEITLLEGCLTYPNIVLPIKRWQGCKVFYDSIHGQRLSLSMNGLQARVVQHEIDHLRGVTFMNKVGPLAKSKAMKDLKRHEND